MGRYAPPGVLVGDDLQPSCSFAAAPAPTWIRRPARRASTSSRWRAPASRSSSARAIQKARRSGEPVRVDCIALRDGEQERKVAVEVFPFTVGAPRRAPRWLLVMFEEQGAGPESVATGPGPRSEAPPPARRPRGAGAERRPRGRARARGDQGLPPGDDRGARRAEPGAPVGQRGAAHQQQRGAPEHQRRAARGEGGSRSRRTRSSPS